MAPDLNSIPSTSSPTHTRSRRTSQQMASSSNQATSPSLHILPSNQSAVNTTSPLASPGLPPPAVPPTAAEIVSQPNDVNVASGGSGPLRHPRPLTAAELHLQLEKEQEAVVNRLTRELSLLRAAHNASVVSNTSSTSAGLPDTADTTTNHLISGPSHPAPSHRHNRTSSNTSNRSVTNTVGSLSSVGGIAGSISSTGIAPERHRSSISNAQSLSRQNSTSRRSGASSPAPSSTSFQTTDPFPQLYQSRPSLSQYREPSSGNTHTDHHHAHRSDSITSVQTSGRYDEVAMHKSELEAVKKENDALKRKIRELERTLRNRSQSDASRTRSESVSTTASVSVGGVALGAGRGRQREEDEDGVRVGESARSAGVGVGRS